MADYRRTEIVSGLFIVLAVAVFGLFAFQVGGLGVPEIVRGARLVCYAQFTDIKSLEKGAKVTVGGEPVGKVTSVRLVEATLTPEQYELLKRPYGPETFPGVEAGMQVLDIGCGWGAMTRAASRRGAHAVGITLADRQLALAEKLAPIDC